jgi:hypothetical protein
MTSAELRAKWAHREEEWRTPGVSVNGEAVAREILADVQKLEQTADDETLNLTDAAREAHVHPDSIGRAIRARLHSQCRPRARTARPSRRLGCIADPSTERAVGGRRSRRRRAGARGHIVGRDHSRQTVPDTKPRSPEKDDGQTT